MGWLWSLLIIGFVTILGLILIMSFGPTRKLAGLGGVTPTGPAAKIAGLTGG